MGVLRDEIKRQSGGDVTSNNTLVPFFKDNTKMMNDLYTNPDSVKTELININKISTGYFYFMLYKDESNWMQYSPVFICDWKKFDDRIICYGINFNFMLMQYRVALFDNIISDLSDNNKLSTMTFEKMYKLAIKVGYEYAIVEYDISRIVKCIKVDYSMLPNFLCSTYPKIKYDPQNLYNIWSKKMETREQRHQEIIKMLTEDFFDVTDELSDNFDALKGHVQRLNRNDKKFK